MIRFLNEVRLLVVKLQINVNPSEKQITRSTESMFQHNGPEVALFSIQQAPYWGWYKFHF